MVRQFWNYVDLDMANAADSCQVSISISWKY